MIKSLTITSLFYFCVDAQLLQTSPPIDTQVGGCHYGNTVYMAGQSWTASDGCNTCYCSAHAGGALCTEMACATTKPLVDVKPVATCEYNKVRYVAGDKYMATDGCNTCVCGSDGTTACTKVFCQRGSCDYNGKRYYVGEMFDDKDGCNTCHCVTHGHVACTEMFCIPFRSNL